MAKTNKKESTNKAGNSQDLSRARLIGIIGGLVILGIVILVSSGIFDVPEAKQISDNTGNSADQFHNHTDLAVLQKINELETQVNNNPANLDLLLQLAHLLNDSGFYEKAVQKYETYLKSKPNEPDVLIDMGVCYYEMDNLSKAEEAMKLALKINPNHQIGHLNLGVVYQAEGKIELSKQMWQKAAEINPNSEIGKRAKSFLNSQ